MFRLHFVYRDVFVSARLRVCVHPGSEDIYREREAMSKLLTLALTLLHRQEIE